MAVNALFEMMTMTTKLESLFSSDEIRSAIRRWYLTRQGDVVLEHGTLEQMTTRQLIDLILEHGTEAEVSAVARKLDFSRGDPYADERRANIKAANEAFDVVAPVLHAKIPQGPGFDVFHERPTHPSVHRALIAVKEWVDGTGPALLTLAGDPGVGKTHLAIAAAKLVAERGLKVVYRTHAAYLKEIQAAFGKDGIADRLADDFGRVDWLVLDEFGQSSNREWSQSTTDSLFDTRWRLAAGGVIRTLVTTNFKSDDIPARIASRLGDVSRGLVVQIDAPDYRREPE